MMKLLAPACMLLSILGISLLIDPYCGAATGLAMLVILWVGGLDSRPGKQS